MITLEMVHIALTGLAAIFALTAANYAWQAANGFRQVAASLERLAMMATKVRERHTYVTGSADGLCAQCRLDALHPIHIRDANEGS